MAQLGMLECSMKCSVHLTTLDRTLKSFGFFPTTMFGEMFGTFDYPRSIIEEFCFFPTSMFGEMFGTFDRGLKDKSAVGMINATKETCHLLTQILTFISHFYYRKSSIKPPSLLSPPLY